MIWRESCCIHEKDNIALRIQGLSWLLRCCHENKSCLWNHPPRNMLSLAIPSTSHLLFTTSFWQSLFYHLFYFLLRWHVVQCNVASYNSSASYDHSVQVCLKFLHGRAHFLPCRAIYSESTRDSICSHLIFLKLLYVLQNMAPN